MAKKRSSSASPAHDHGADETVLTGYLPPAQLATVLNVSERTLQRWHGLRCGPPRITVGHTILYNVAKVRRWLQDHEVEPIRGAGRVGHRRD